MILLCPNDGLPAKLLVKCAYFCYPDMICVFFTEYGQSIVSDENLDKNITFHNIYKHVFVVVNKGGVAYSL